MLIDFFILFVREKLDNPLNKIIDNSCFFFTCLSVVCDRVAPPPPVPVLPPPNPPSCLQY